MYSKLYIASDHHGVKLKQVLKRHLEQKGYEVYDFGSHGETLVDYPVYARKVAQAVSKDSPHACGILICSSGAGMCMTANHFPHVRASISWSQKHAYQIRHEDDVNVLCIAADYVEEEQALAITDTWFSTPFSGEERHVRRIRQIDHMANNHPL